jgi:hypothetical protein
MIGAFCDKGRSGDFVSKGVPVQAVIGIRSRAGTMRSPSLIHVTLRLCIGALTCATAINSGGAGC